LKHLYYAQNLSKRERLIASVRVEYPCKFPIIRTFPKALSTFRNIVDERGARLRKLPFEELARLGETPIERLSVESRPATIGIIVQPLPSGGIRVVVQGFMKAKLLGHNVALDGFYKYSDETAAPMAEEEFNQFG
jgi:hypothetical protein